MLFAIFKYCILTCMTDSKKKLKYSTQNWQHSTPYTQSWKGQGIDWDSYLSGI